jgi:hypothetical protein
VINLLTWKSCRALVALAECAPGSSMMMSHDPFFFTLTRFLLESVLDLKQQLRALGSDLLIKVGQPEDILPTLLHQSDGKNRFEHVLLLYDDTCSKPFLLSSWLVACKEVCSEEVSVEAAVEKAVSSKAQVKLLWGSTTLYHVEDVVGLYKRSFFRFERKHDIVENFMTADPNTSFDNFPDGFTSFRKKVEDNCTPRQVRSAARIDILDLFLI